MPMTISSKRGSARLTILSCPLVMGSNEQGKTAMFIRRNQIINEGTNLMIFVNGKSAIPVFPDLERLYIALETSLRLMFYDQPAPVTEYFSFNDQVRKPVSICGLKR